jgi:parallel beta-helix repeat protein
MNNTGRMAHVRARVCVVLAVLSFLWPGPLPVSQAATYYVDGSSHVARDTNPGTEALPFKTINKATSLVNAGDTVFIKAGIYRETAILSRSGTSTTAIGRTGTAATLPITITASPGHEGKVILSAAEPVIDWRKCTGPAECAGNANWPYIYVADVSALVQAHPDPWFAVRQVFQHGKLLKRSRYPDIGWSYPTSIGDPGKSFSDDTLSRLNGYFTGAVCHIKTAVWQIDQIPIADYSRGTITLSQSPRYAMTTRFGYYITNIVGEINAEGEWAYDPAQKRIYLWPRGDVPGGVEFSYRDNCLESNSGTAWNVVRGLTMRYAYRCGIRLDRSHHMQIEDNTIEYAYFVGLQVYAGTGATGDYNQIVHNTIRYCADYGLSVDMACSHTNVEGNYIYGAGTDAFGGDLMNGPSWGMFISGPYTRVYNNRIDRTGLGGMYVFGQTLSRDVSYNHITNSGLALADTGGIYMGGGFTDGPQKDHIHHNIIADTIGCRTMDRRYDVGGLPSPQTYSGEGEGIYIDEQSNNRVIEYNTVINCRSRGIYFHWAPGNVVQHNTLYGNGENQVRFNGDNNDRQRLIDDVLLDNILFSTTAEQYTLWVGMNYDGIRFGQSDRNRFCNPYNNRHIFVSWLNPDNNVWTTEALSLSSWQARSGYDRNSKEFSYVSELPQVTLARPTKSRIVYNASLDVNTVDLGPDLYCDVQGHGIRGKLTLQPFESKILITAVAAPVSHQATDPVPADGAQVGVVPLLEWTAAATGALHNVYLGTDQNAVSAAGVTSSLFQGQQTGTSFSLQGLVQPGGRYYWRVDEVEADGTTIHKGVVWTFTVPGYLAIDDFESYADKTGSRLEETWTDGSRNHTGAQVDRASSPSAGPMESPHGAWSMFLAYDNTRAPFVSEVERDFAPEQDWTAAGMNTLSLWFLGDVVSFGETTPGTFTMTAAGADIWAARDEFRYAYKQLNGDGAIVARVNNVSWSNAWAKAGVMIRASLNPGSAHAFMLVTPDGRRAFQNRPFTNSGTCRSAHSNVEAISLPFWVKLQRQGNRFTGYYSRDGVNWVPQSDTEYTGSDASPNPQTISMPARVYVGLALTSHVSGTAATATFSGVRTTGSVTGSWQVADIGADHPGNSPDDLYVIVADSKGNSATVVHPDPAAVNTPAWTEWKVPLSSLAGVDLHRVRQMSIGVGGRQAATAPGTGRIYIDDIRVLQSEPTY